MPSKNLSKKDGFWDYLSVEYIRYNNDKKITLFDLYHQGWKVDTDVSRANNFVFVLSK